MAPPKRNKRLVVFFACALLAIVGVSLLVTALRSNTQFFHSPSAVTKQGFVPKSEVFRVGGLVVPGSFISQSGTLHVFEVADFEATEADKPLKVTYSGVLPDLFGEGEGVVVSGSIDTSGKFIAQQVLAKHDNEYVPDLPANGS